MRVLIAGTGSAGKRHARNLARMAPQVRFAFLRRQAIHDDFSNGMDAELVDSVDAALSWRPELAVIASPSANHFDLLVPLLAGGIACYIEKPVVATRVHADRLESWLAAARHVPPTQCGCNLRFLPSLVALHKRVHDGSIGHIVRASLQVGQWLPDWRPGSDYRNSYSARTAFGGGAPLDLVHELDAARWLFGEFDRVAAFGGHFSGLEIDSDDTAVALLARPQGPAVAVSMDYVARRSIRHYEVVGDGGTLSWDMSARILRLDTANRVETLTAEASDFDVGPTYELAMKELIDEVAGVRPASQPIGEGLRSSRLAIEVSEQIRR